MTHCVWSHRTVPIKNIMPQPPSPETLLSTTLIASRSPSTSSLLCLVQQSHARNSSSWPQLFQSFFSSTSTAIVVPASFHGRQVMPGHLGTRCSFRGHPGSLFSGQPWWGRLRVHCWSIIPAFSIPPLPKEREIGALYHQDDPRKIKEGGENPVSPLSRWACYNTTVHSKILHFRLLG